MRPPVRAESVPRSGRRGWQVSASSLAQPVASPALRESVQRAVAAELGADPGLAPVLSWVDRGRAHADGGRYWTLDPIDGTKGFLRGEQYAVALALIEGGEVVVGLLGCPNLPDAAGGRGLLFTAVRGEGARRYPLWETALTAGKLVVEEAGGRVSDVDGQALNFRTGRTLGANRGVVATCGPIHDEVIAAIRQVRGG